MTARPASSYDLRALSSSQSPRSHVDSSNSLAKFWTLGGDLFSLQGRSNRLTFAVAVNAALSIPMQVMLAEGLGYRMTLPDAAPRFVVAVCLTALLGIGIALAWFSLAHLVRRLHDIGLSGWWSFGALAAIPIVKGTAFVLLGPLSATNCCARVGFALLGWLFVLRGDSKPNRFGPPPQRGVRIMNASRGVGSHTPA